MTPLAPRRIGSALPYLLLLIFTFTALGLSNLGLHALVESSVEAPFKLPQPWIRGFLQISWGLYGLSWLVLLGCTVAAITKHWRSMRRELNLLGGLLGVSLILNLIDVNLHLSAGKITGLLLLYEGMILYLSVQSLWAFYYWSIDEGPAAHRAFWWVPPPSFRGSSEDWQPRFLDYFYLAAVVSFSFYPNVEPIQSRSKLFILVQLFVVFNINVVLIARAVGLLA
jgi:hypothetical protein